MTPWDERSVEERHLLNPGFCAMLLWHAAQGYAASQSKWMAIELSFLVLPFVLHKETRESLPSNIKTSLPTWLTEYPIIRARLGERSVTLRNFTREALILGGSHELLSLTHAGIHANTKMRKRVNTALKETSDEVRECAKGAEFLGRWLENAGDSGTVMLLLGVRP
jgi:hypothetical protein